MPKRISCLVAVALIHAVAVFAEFNYLDDKAAANQLLKKRDIEGAKKAFVTLAGKEITDFQKADALGLAVGCAIRQRNYDEARKLAESIPLEGFKIRALMDVNYHDRKEKDSVDRFKDVDFDQFQEVIRGDLYNMRGRAFIVVKMPERAKADYAEALKYLKDVNTISLLTSSLASVYLNTDNDPDKAIETYRSVYPMHEYKGASAAMAVAGILRDQGKFDEALAELDKIDSKVLKSHVFNHQIILARASILRKKGDDEQAKALYETILKDDKSPAWMKKTSEKALADMKAEAEKEEIKPEAEGRPNADSQPNSEVKATN